MTRWLPASWSLVTNAAILLLLAALVFVPIRYLYPSRTPVFRLSTNLLSAIWGVAILVMIWQYPSVSRSLFFASFAFPVYYVVLSLFVRARSRLP
jgi:phosphatidylcholine synthase